MRLVLDTNVLLTYFWETSTLREVCKLRKAELFAPEFALKEFNKHAREVFKRARVPDEKFGSVCKELFSKITILDSKDYDEFFRECKASFIGLTENERCELEEDADFLAVSIMLCCPLWSNDKLLKKQKKVDVLNTAEVVSLLDIDYTKP